MLLSNKYRSRSDTVKKIAIIIDNLIFLTKTITYLKTIFNKANQTIAITTYKNIAQIDKTKSFDFLLINQSSLITYLPIKQYLDNHPDCKIILLENNDSFDQFIYLDKENFSSSFNQTLLSPDDHSKLRLRIKNDFCTINKKDIIYCHSCGHQSFIHTVKTTITTRYKLSSLETMIASNDFYLINQSVLINWFYVDKINNREITLNNNTKLTISTRRYKQAIAAYQKYIISK